MTILFHFRKKTDSKNSKAAKANKRKLLILSKCAVCDSTKLRYIKEQVSGLFSSLDLNQIQ